MPGSKPTVARHLAMALVARGIRTVYLVPGFNVDPLVVSLAGMAGLTCVRCSQELTAGMMAHGEALEGQGPVACLAMGGPGAVALLPAVVTARMERAPVLFLTGAMPTWTQGLEAFQSDDAGGGRDLDLFGSALDTSLALRHAHDLDGYLDEAFHALEAGLPAHIQVPHDLLTAFWEPGPTAQPGRQAPPVDASLLREWLGQRGPRVAVLVGEEPVSAEAWGRLQAFAEAQGLPVATTLGAKGALPEDHPLALGHFGYAGSPRASQALLDPALEGLLVLGAELGDRNTLRWDHRLRALGDRLLHVASHPAPVNAYTKDFLTLKGSWPEVMKGMPAGLQPEGRQAWTANLRETPLSLNGGAGWDVEAPLHPGRLVAELRQWLPRDTPVVVDAGAHRVFTAHHWRALTPRGLLSASRSAPLGWAVAAGMGVAMAGRRERVWVFTGDGCMAVAGAELATAAVHRLPVTVVVFNNAAYGNVLLRYQAAGGPAEALARVPEVDWASFAALLGVPGRRVCRLQDLEAAVAEALATEGPFLLDVRVQADAAHALPSTLFSPCGPRPSWLDPIDEPRP